SSRSASFEKLSLPSTLTPFKPGGLTSRTTSKPAPIVTTSPACGTFPPDHVDASDHRPSLTASCASALTVKKAVASNERYEKRWSKRMTLSPENPCLYISRFEQIRLARLAGSTSLPTRSHS